MTISNGLAWSPDGRTMYHADTPARTDSRVRLRRRDRDAEPRRGRSRSGRATTDRPDGGAIDSAGNYWTRVLPRRQARAARRRTATLVAEYPVPAMCPTMCAFGGADLRTLLRDDRAPEARRRRARALPAKRRHLRDARRRSRHCRKRAFAADDAQPMQLDPADYLRLDVPHSLGATAAGASFATSSGDILDVECFGPGAFRLRVGPNTRPDYGIVVARAKGCTVAQRAPGAWTFTSDDATLEIGGSPLRIRLLVEGRRSCCARSPTSICAAARGCRRSAGCARAGCGPRRSRSRRASRCTVSARNSARSTSAGSSIHSQVAGRAGRQHRARRTRTRRSRGAPAAGKGAWGTFVHTPGHGDARRRPSRLVASQLRGDGRGRGARPLPVRRRDARRRSSISTRS